MFHVPLAVMSPWWREHGGQIGNKNERDDVGLTFSPKWTIRLCLIPLQPVGSGWKWLDCLTESLQCWCKTLSKATQEQTNRNLFSTQTNLICLNWVSNYFCRVQLALIPQPIFKCHFAFLFISTIKLKLRDKSKFYDESWNFVIKVKSHE